MGRRISGTIAALAVGASILLTSGCSLFPPTRDANGNFAEPTVINSSDLLTGDCFSFVDNTNLTKSTVVECSADHSFVVIDQGELDAATVDAAGGLQNAVNVACDEPFSEFKAAAADGVKPEQQFLTSEVERDGATLTKYSCLATDAAPAS